jgi:hypothetical protein
MNYAKLAATANKLLSGAGQTVTISRYAPSRNASTAEVTKGTATVTGTAYAVEVPITQNLIQSFGKAFDGNVLKERRAFKVSASALGFFPESGDELVMSDDSVWPVIGATQVNPAGTPLFYTVGVAK